MAQFCGAKTTIYIPVRQGNMRQVEPKLGFQTGEESGEWKERQEQ